MSAIEDFRRTHGTGENRKVDDIVRQWVHEKEVDDFLGTPVTAGVLLGDLLCGDGLQDQISPDLLKGFSELMGDKADSYDAVRQNLLEKLAAGDSSVGGLINKIKGQIGENTFIEHVGGTARLAESGSQEGWDVVVNRPGVATQWVQVKTYGDANGVMKEIYKVQEKVNARKILDDAGNQIDRVDFAVPENIVDEVRDKVLAAGIKIKVLPIGISADDAGGVVSDGFDNVGPESMFNFFGELFGGTVTAAALHGAVNAFLIYKGAKERNRFIEDTAYSTGVSSGGMTAAFATEAAFHKLAGSVAILGGPVTWIATFGVGMSARMYLNRVADRRHTVERLAADNEQLGLTIARMTEL